MQYRAEGRKGEDVDTQSMLEELAAVAATLVFEDTELESIIKSIEAFTLETLEKHRPQSSVPVSISNPNKNDIVQESQLNRIKLQVEIVVKGEVRLGKGVVQRVSDHWHLSTTFSVKKKLGNLTGDQREF